MDDAVVVTKRLVVFFISTSIQAHLCRGRLGKGAHGKKHVIEEVDELEDDYSPSREPSPSKKRFVFIVISTLCSYTLSDANRPLFLPVMVKCLTMMSLEPLLLLVQVLTLETMGESLHCHH